MASAVKNTPLLHYMIWGLFVQVLEPSYIDTINYTAVISLYKLTWHSGNVRMQNSMASSSW